MTTESQELVQLLNTAIIKTKEKKIDSSYEDRLAKACNNPTISAISLAITHLAETQRISRDQAATQIVETIRDLDSVWNDYVMMEGLGRLKEMLKSDPRQ